MKSVFERIENLSFKKAFIVFFAAFLVFVVAYASNVARSGRWSAALEHERSRMEIMRSDATGRETGAISGRLGRLNQRFNHGFEHLQARFERLNRNPDDRFLYGAARVWSRITSTEFSPFNFFGRLFKVTFSILLALWVYADSKKHGKNKVFWPILTLFTSVIGWLVYMVVRENNKNRGGEAIPV
jgi:hypothetical protein